MRGDRPTPLFSVEGQTSVGEGGGGSRRRGRLHRIQPCTGKGGRYSCEEEEERCVSFRGMVSSEEEVKLVLALFPGHPRLQFLESGSILVPGAIFVTRSSSINTGGIARVYSIDCRGVWGNAPQENLQVLKWRLPLSILQVMLPCKEGY